MGRPVTPTPPPRPGVSTGSGPGTVYGARVASGTSARRPGRPHKTWKDVLRLFVKYGTLAVSALIIFGVVAFAVAYARTPLPKPDQDSEAQATKVFWGDNSEMGILGTKTRFSITLDQVPKHVQNAVIAAEDTTFWDNSGVSPRGITRAVINNLRGGDQQGGSTITQQYVKNVYVGSEQTLKRKSKEFLLALKVNRKLKKEQILERYLNAIYWGRGTWGIEAAAQAYFKCPASKLTVAQGAYLAVLIRSPGLYTQDIKEGETSIAHKERMVRAEFAWNDVLNKMVEHGWLTPADRAKQKLPKFEPYRSTMQDFSGPNGYLYAAIRKELADSGVSEQLIDGGGLRIYTTFDKKLQEEANRAMENLYEPIQKKDPKVHASLVSIQPGSGAVLAMYGGSDYKQVQFNSAMDGHLQAGSTFKPFTMLTGLKDKQYNVWDKRWNGNAPLTIKTGNPKDPERTVNNATDGPASKYGIVDIVEATERSINTAYVDIAQHVGFDQIRKTIEDLGITRNLARGLNAEATMTLGSAAVRPIDLANAYASIAAGCQRAKPHLIREAQTPNGTVVYRGPDSAKPVFSDLSKENAGNLCADVLFVMNRVATQPYATGRVAASLNDPGTLQIAAKTGTAQDNKSAWYVGVTPKIATAVNFYGESVDAQGNATLRSLNGVGGYANFYGGGLPGKIWYNYMLQVFNKNLIPKVEFARSTDGLTVPPVTAPPAPPSGQPTDPSDPNATNTPTASTLPTGEPTLPTLPTTPTSTDPTTEPTTPTSSTSSSSLPTLPTTTTSSTKPKPGQQAGGG